MEGSEEAMLHVLGVRRDQDIAMVSWCVSSVGNEGG